MPVGLNQVVKRFVKGHLYKIYNPKTPERYAILRFKRLGYVQRAINCDASCNLDKKAYFFIPVADNVGFNTAFHRSYLVSQIDLMVVEDVPIENLPMYLGAKSIGVEFERVLKGESIYRRKRSRILPDKVSSS